MKTAQEFLQDWKKQMRCNRPTCFFYIPVYPEECKCKWDRLKVNQFAKAYDDYVGLVWDKSGKVYNIKNNGEKNERRNREI